MENTMICNHPADAERNAELLMTCPECGAECGGTSIGDDSLCYDEECPLHARQGHARACEEML